MTIKEQLHSAIDSLPDQATIDDAMEKIYFMYKVEKGIEQADNGQTVPHEEAKEKIFKMVQLRWTHEAEVV